MTDLLKMLDLDQDEIMGLLDLAAKLKEENKQGIRHPLLANKTLGMIFQKSSTRTRVSFEVGMYQLGGTALFLSGNDIQLGRGESIEDTARVLERYLDGVMIRTFDQSDVEEFALHARIPVINGLTDFAHPCQVLADLMTIREYKGRLDGLKLCYIGDGNNMANSLIAGCLKIGMGISIACPKDYLPDAGVIAYAYEQAASGAAFFTLSDDVMAACKDADVLVTDTWISMGQEEEKTARRKAFAGYQINEAVVAGAKPDVMVLHCLPAYKGEEITQEVFDRFSGCIFDEAENRLHAQKAVLVKLMG